MRLPCPCRGSPPAHSPWPPALRWAVLALVALGVAWRLLRYLLQFPVWGDEAYVCLNFLDRDLLGLTQPLRYVQVAPLLFLWTEWTICHLLGGSELALRLVPLLAGGAALGLFVPLARRMLDPLAAALAVGLLAVSYYPVRHSCEIKPYSLDLLLAVALLLAAWSWLRWPERVAPLIALVLLGPLGLALSYPSLFIAGAVSLVLLPAVWRRPGWAVRVLYLAYNVLLVGSFVLLYGVVGRAQYGSTGGAGNWYWQGSFPPPPLALLAWLVQIHTGYLMAYPLGGPNGLSALTFLLFVIGAGRLVRERRWQLLALCLVPFALTLAAAALHRYPYGGSARIAQHLAPAICLLAGNGLGGLIRAARPAAAARWGLAVCGLLLLVGLGGVARDWLRPYKTEGDLKVRALVAELFREAGPADQIVVINDAQVGKGATFEWYLRRQQERISWDGHIAWERLPGESGTLWLVCFSHDAASQARQLSGPPGYRLVLVSHAQHQVQLGKSEDTLEYCELFRWQCTRE